MTTPDRSVDVLMLVHERPHFTRLALARLLETCDETMRVWIWRNGQDRATAEVVESFCDHPALHAVHHSPSNTGVHGQWRPIDWLLSETSGRYVSKVDDDCLMPDGWADTLRAAHEDVPELGVVGCWRFRPEDVRPDLVAAKLATYAGGHRVLRNSWIEGTGFVMKRACIDAVGPLPAGRRFPKHCIHIAAAGWTNGWYYPFLHQEHMDDPRSPFWTLEHGAATREPRRERPAEHVRRIRARALTVQRAGLDPHRYLHWAARLRWPA